MKIIIDCDKLKKGKNWGRSKVKERRRGRERTRRKKRQGCENIFIAYAPFN